MDGVKTPTAGAMAGADTRVRLAVERHLDLIWRVLRRSGLRPSDAEDAAQDVFWVFAQRTQDVPAVAERSFLVSTALRIAADRRRSRWYRSATEPLDADARVFDGPQPDEALELRRAGVLLEQALEQLPPADRAVFVLAELEQMSRSEVAEALDIPEGTVASRLRRARAGFADAVAAFRAKAGSRT